MRKLMITLSMIVLSAGMMFAQAPTKTTAAKKTAAPGTTVSDELKQMENDWVAASKAKALADLKSPGNSLDSFEIGPMTVRVGAARPAPR